MIKHGYNPNFDTQDNTLLTLFQDYACSTNKTYSDIQMNYILNFMNLRNISKEQAIQLSYKIK